MQLNNTYDNYSYSVDSVSHSLESDGSVVLGVQSPDAKLEVQRKRDVNFIEIDSEETKFYISFNFAGYEKEDISVKFYEQKLDENSSKKFIRLEWEEDDETLTYDYYLPNKVIMNDYKAYFKNGLLSFHFKTNYKEKTVEVE